MQIKKHHIYKRLSAVMGTAALSLFLLLGSCATAPQEGPEQPTIGVYSAEKIEYISPANSPGYQDLFHAPYAIRTADEVDVQELETVVTNSSGEEVYFKTYQSREELPTEIVWHGRDNTGEFVSDGTYTLSAEVTDSLQQSVTSDAYKILVDNQLPEATVKVSPTVFSPNADGNQDTVQISQSGTEEKRWTGFILDSNEDVVRSWRWTDTKPQDFRWKGETQDGTTAPDGEYTYVLKGFDRAGNKVRLESSAIILSNETASLTLSATYRAFSPVDNNTRDTLPIKVAAPEPEKADEWSYRIENTDGEELYRRSGTSTPPKEIVLQGEMEGTKLQEGTYRLHMQITYKNGDTLTDRTPELSLDTSPPRARVELQAEGFSPNGDGEMESIQINQETEQGYRWTGRIWPAENENPVLETGWEQDVPDVFSWNGQTDGSQKAESGRYFYELQGRDRAGNTVTAATDTFTLDIQPPRLEASIENIPFTPDDDGNNDVLEIDLNAEDNFGIEAWKVTIVDPKGNQFHSIQGSEIPAEPLRWNGKSANGELVQSAEDYTARIRVLDPFANAAHTETEVPVGILVAEEPNGDYRIRITRIRFVPFEADYQNLEDQSQVAENKNALDRLAEILMEYPDHDIRIEGHAVHLFYGDEELREEEQQETLLPLSRKRAEAIKEALVERGVKAERITTAGRGGSEPVVPHSDMDDRWKNRRVEFELIRRQS